MIGAPSHEPIQAETGKIRQSGYWFTSLKKTGICSSIIRLSKGVSAISNWTRLTSSALAPYRSYPVLIATCTVPSFTSMTLAAS